MNINNIDFDEFNSRHVSRIIVEYLSGRIVSYWGFTIDDVLSEVGDLSLVRSITTG